MTAQVIFLNTMHEPSDEIKNKLDLIQCEFNYVRACIEQEEKDAYMKMIRKERLRNYLKSKIELIS